MEKIGDIECRAVHLIVVVNGVRHMAKYNQDDKKAFKVIE